MNFGEILFIAVGVSIDALAVSVACGVAEPRRIWRNAFLGALFFGGFQFLMPVLGWYLGVSLRNVITGVDHYIAFLLLAMVGGKMLWEAIKESRKPCSKEHTPNDDLAKRSMFHWKNLLVLAVATSLDALAVGASLAMIDVRIWLPAAAMGVVTAMASIFGIFCGKILGCRFQCYAGMAAGAIIVLIGVKILIEHLCA